MRPTEWLVEQRPLLEAQPHGRALDLACGRGRNALFLAELGFEVDAVDIDPEALAELRRDAEARSLTLTTVQADLTAAPLPRPPYEVILDVNYLERTLFATMADALAAGGLLVFETFLREHVEVLGRRMNECYLLEPNELLRAFAGLRVLRYREAILAEDPPRAVASLVARRA